MTIRRRTTRREKLADDKGLPKVIEITGKLSRRWGTSTCAITAPRVVNWETRLSAVRTVGETVRGGLESTRTRARLSP